MSKIPCKKGIKHSLFDAHAIEHAVRHLNVRQHDVASYQFKKGSVKKGLLNHSKLEYFAREVLMVNILR